MTKRVILVPYILTIANKFNLFTRVGFPGHHQNESCLVEERTLWALGLVEGLFFDILFVLAFRIVNSVSSFQSRL